MKSYDKFLLGVLGAILKDVASWYPEGATEWMRAQARLHSLVKTRGVRFLTVDLVAAGKHFDRCLEVGAYSPSNLPGQASREGLAVPRLFEGLLVRVFSRTSGKLRRNVDITAISYLRQLYYAVKKIRMDANDSATYKTVAEFVSIEEAQRNPSLPWDEDTLCDRNARLRLHIADGMRLSPGLEEPTFGFSEEHDAPRLGVSDLYPGVLDTIQHVADIVSSGLGSLDLLGITPRHGPGAVADRQGESKYDFPHWPQKLEGSFPSGFFAYYREGSWLDDELDGGPLLSKGEPPSRLIAVPKTLKAPRLIAAEPTAHQWIQQGILDTLVSRMDKTLLSNCVSIRDQEPSRRLALQASIHRHLSTIDLSEASDRVSCWLVERMFRGNLDFLLAFHACRTRWLRNKIDRKSPEFVKLRKFTTMGSALTFPVQSIIYAIVSIGVDVWYRKSILIDGRRQPSIDVSRFQSGGVLKEAISSSRRIRVFGDDIIHPVESTDLLMEVLSYLGLKVNLHKTFSASFFRESCGIDAYQGIEVTPCYVNEVPCDTEPESLISVVESSNNFHKRGLWNTADYLVNALPPWFRRELGVKAVGSGAFGLSSFVGADVSHLKSRWNDQLHHWEVRAYVALPKGNKKRGIRGSAALLQYFTEKPPATVKWLNGVGLGMPLKLKRMGIPSYFYN